MIHALFALGGVVAGVLVGVMFSCFAFENAVARLELQIDYLHTLTRCTPWSSRMRGMGDTPDKETTPSK